MDIIFQGIHDTEEACESLLSVMRLFKDRYQIGQFREMHLTLTLLDEAGYDVELVDSKTNAVYRNFEVCREGSELSLSRRHNSVLKLVVDNTR